MKKELPKHNKAIKGGGGEKINTPLIKSSNTIEIIQSLCSWPTFGFVFLLLFYPSMIDVFKVLPRMLLSTKELNVPGISIKMTIQDEANRLGASSLTGIIPKLSTAALRCLLLQSQYGHSSLSTIFGQEGNLTNRVSLPTQETIYAFFELEKLGFVKLTSESWAEDGLKTYERIDAFKRTYPGVDEIADNKSQQIWVLTKPTEVNDIYQKIPDLIWETTPLGSQAVEVIVQSLSRELDSK